MDDFKPQHRSLSGRCVLAVLLLLGLVASACSVAPNDVVVTPLRGGRTAADTASGAASGLPAVGPAPGSSHWHAAYVVRICDDVLPPFDSDADPLGIHSHADGLIHVHPFFEESGFEEATLGLFADAMGLELATGELRLPGGGTWRDGDLCNGVPGRVYVDRWADPAPDGVVERIFANPDDIQFAADGELYQIAFAPVDAPPVVPPSWQLLPQVSNLLGPSPEPWIRVDAAADPATVSLWTVAGVSAGPCVDEQVEESVLYGEASCFERGDDVFAGSEAITAARAVSFNRQPAVELTITPLFRNFIFSQFAPNSQVIENGLVIAVEVEGRVVTAPLLTRPSASETRLVLAGGLSVDSARDLANVLAG
jgi:hypothetical protein